MNKIELYLLSKWLEMQGKHGSETINCCKVDFNKCPFTYTTSESSGKVLNLEETEGEASHPTEKRTLTGRTTAEVHRLIGINTPTVQSNLSGSISYQPLNSRLFSRFCHSNYSPITQLIVVFLLKTLKNMMIYITDGVFRRPVKCGGGKTESNQRLELPTTMWSTLHKINYTPSIHWVLYWDLGVSSECQS